MRRDYSTLTLWLKGNVPGVLLFTRICQFLFSELLYFLVFSNAITRHLMQWVSFFNLDTMVFGKGLL